MLDDGNKISYRIGVWGRDTEDESSNWREFENIVSAIEEDTRQGSLIGSHLIMATDNQVVEACFYKGNSTSKKLYNLVLRVRELELKNSMKIFITHVSGTRMIAQGTDGLSRGSVDQGVGSGEAMTKFFPWGLSACQRSPRLETWIKS